MGMGNYPCFAEVIEEDFVKEQCPELLDKLKILLDKLDISFDQFATYFDESQGNDMLADGISLEDQKTLHEAYHDLQDEFEQKTGLILLVIYTCDEDEADRGCEVTGGCWSVGGVYQLSPAGEKYKDKIERKFWTVFG